MNSIMQGDKRECYLCGRTGGPLEWHHVFFGTANRRLSEEDGLKVLLCPECHRTGRRAVHRNRETADYLKREGQRAWEKKYGTRSEFLARYGKNYL